MKKMAPSYIERAYKLGTACGKYWDTPESQFFVHQDDSIWVFQKGRFIHNGKCWDLDNTNMNTPEKRQEIYSAFKKTYRYYMPLKEAEPSRYPHLLPAIHPYIRMAMNESWFRDIEASTKIQAAFRGYSTRKRLKKTATAT